MTKLNQVCSRSFNWWALIGLFLANGNKTYHFIQHVPMSTYLVAIASGALTSREIGPRSRVWCEKEMIDASAYEFAETEDYIKAGVENIFLFT